MIAKFNGFFLVHRHIGGKIFVKISNFYVKLLTDKQTDRLADKRRALHNVIGGLNNRTLSDVRSPLPTVGALTNECHATATQGHTAH